MASCAILPISSDLTAVCWPGKTHLVPVEAATGHAVADTPVSRLAFPACVDHGGFDTARIAALSGADRAD